MAALKADRRLCFTADGAAMVEETDPRAAYLAYPAGRFVSPSDVEKFDLSAKDGRIVLPGVKMVASAKVKDVPAPDGDVPEWPLSSTPEEYLERYGEDAKNSALARAVIEAAEG